MIGGHHTNFCEDYLLYEKLGSDTWLMAVLDGCTMGKESYFASALTGKLLRKIARECYYLDFRTPLERTPKEHIQAVMKALFAELVSLKNQLLLSTEELLTTLMLCVVDAQQQKGAVLVVGDGVVCVNGQLIELDQQNIPDYLGYHLKEDFDEWFAKQHQWVDIEKFTDVSICTDGILAFGKADTRTYAVHKDPIDYLLHDTEFSDHENMLRRKLLFLENTCGLKPTDDLAIIRLMR